MRVLALKKRTLLIYTKPKSVVEKEEEEEEDKTKTKTKKRLKSSTSLFHSKENVCAIHE